MFNKWKKTKSYLFNKLGELPMGGGFSPSPVATIFMAIGAVFNFLAKPAVQLGLFVAQGVMAHRQAMKAKRTGAEILLQKYGTGAGMPVIYGTRRVAGTVVYMNTTNNKELFVVYAIAGHEIDSFDLESLQIDGRTIKDTKIYRQGYDISDGTTRIAFRPSGETRTSGTFWGNTSTERANITGGANTGDNARMTFNCHKGANNQTADPMLSGIISEWTSDHKLSGIAYIACNYEYDIQGMFTGIPNLTVVVNGKKVYDPRTTNTTFSSNPALCLLDYLTDDEYGKGLSLTNDIDTASFSTSANDCDVSADTITHSSVVVENANTSTDILRLANANEDDFNNFKVGNTYTVTDGSTTYISAKKLIDKDVTEIDNDGSTAFTLLKLKFEDGAVDNAITSNTTCTFTETQIRFDCNGVLDTDETVLENTKLLVANMRGIFTYSNGKYSIKVEGTESSVVSLDEDDILESGITLSLENKEAKYNKVEAEFYNAQKKYETDTTYYTGETSDTFLSDDGNEVLETRIQLPFCTNQRIAYNHAKAMLKRSRSQKTISFVATPKVLKAKVGEVISVTNSNLNLSSEQYRITNMVINPDLNISVNAIEYQTAIYGYVTPPNEEIGIGQDPVIGNRVEAPSSLTFTNKNATTGEPAKLTWTDSSKYPSYEFRVQIIDGVKTRYDRRVKDTTFYLDGISIANGYQAKVSAINALGVESDTTDITVNVTTAPITTVDIGQGSIGGFSFDASKMYHGTGTFNNTNTAVYIDDSGQFSLKNKLSFDGTTLNISGNLTVENTITADKIVVDGINLDNLISATTQSGSIYLTEFTGIKIATAGASNGYPALLRMQDDQGTNCFTDITQSQTGINIRARANTAQGTIRFQGIGSGITPVNYGGFDASGNFEIGTTDVIDASRNVKNLSKLAIGTATTTYGINVVGTSRGDASSGIVTFDPSYPTLVRGELNVNSSGAGYFMLKNGSNNANVQLHSAGTSYINGGNLGVGTTTPDRQLEVYGTNDGYMKFDGGRTDNHGFTIGSDTYGFIIYDDTSSSYRFAIDQDSGNVGIGTVSPTDKLELYANGADVALKIHEDAGTHSARLHLREGTQDTYLQNRSGAGFEIRTEGNISTSNTPAMQINSAGNITAGYNLIVSGDLTVNGTTTTLNTATLDVEDKNITLNYSTGDSSSSANGAGFTIQDAVSAGNDATILWDATNDEFDFSHGITLPDDKRLKLGNSSDLQIYHDSSLGSIIEDVGSGALDIRTNGNRAQFSKNGTEFIAKFIPDGAVELYYDNSKKFETTSTGIDVTGTAIVDGLTNSGDATFNGDVTFELAGASVTVDNGNDKIRFDDNIKATFGNGDDLQIYHDGTHSYIEETNGTGNLYIRGESIDIRRQANGEQYILAQPNGAVTLFYDGASKLATTSGGINVTGAITSSGTITSTGNGVTNVMSFSDRGIFGTTSNHPVEIRTNGTEAIRIDTSQRVGIGTNAPAEDLHIKDNGDVSIALENQSDTSGNYWKLWQDNWDGSTTFTFNIDYGTTNVIKAKTTGDVTVPTGNVGIGTTSPSEKLHVKTTSNTVAKFETSLTSDLAIELANSQGSMFFGLGGGEEFAVGTDSDLNGSNSLFVIKQDGKVGIGKTAPAQKLDVAGDIGINGTTVINTSRNLTNIGSITSTGLLNVNTGSTNTVALFQSGDDKAFIRIEDDDTNAYLITKDGHFSIGENSSDLDNFKINLSSGNTTIAGTISSGAISASTNTTLDGVKVSGNNAPVVQITNGQTTSIARMMAQTTYSSVGTASNHPLQLRTNDTTALSIDTSQRVGIGTTSPGEKLHVNGKGFFNNTVITNTAVALKLKQASGTENDATEFRTGGGEFKIFSGRDSGTHQDFVFATGDNYTSGAVRMTIDSSGHLDLKTGNYKVNGTTVIDTSRNLHNIGTISSGAITSSGVIESAMTGNAKLIADGTTHANVEIDRGNTSSHNNLIYRTAGAVKWRIWQDGADNILKVRNEVAGTNVLTFTDTNSSFAGTISSGAITSTGQVNADELVVQNDSTFNGGIDASGQTITSGAITSSGDISIPYGNSYKGVGTTNDEILKMSFTSGVGDILNIAPAGNSSTSEIALKTSVGSTVTERVRIDSSGRVGINTTDPDGQGYPFAEDLVILGGASASDGVGITLRGNGKRYGVIAFGDDADNNAGEIWYDHNANSMNFRTAGTLRATIGSSGNFNLNTGDLKIGDISVITSARNLTNIGTISASTATFSTALDASITVQSTDATTGIVFTDNGGTGHLYYLGGSDKFYTDGKFAVNGSVLSGGMVFQVNGNSNFAGTITSNGDMAIDTDTLFVDVSTDRVGINAGTAPSYSLHVGGDIYASQTIQTKEFQNIKVGDASIPANTAGYYKIAEVVRGTGTIQLSFTGGNFSPTTYVIHYFRNWSTQAEVKLNKYGVADHITKARIRKDSDDNDKYFVEVYFASNSNAPSFQVYHKQLDGYFNGSNQVFTGSLTAGSTNGVTYAEEDFVDNGMTMEQLNVTKINSNAQTLVIGGTAGTSTVGIGDTSPAYALEVNEASNYAGIHIRGSNAPSLSFGRGTNSTQEWKVGLSGTNGANFAISTGTTNTDRLIIDASGNAGINAQPSSSYKLDVGGSVRFSGSASLVGLLQSYSGVFNIKNIATDQDIRLQVNDGGTNTTALSVQGSTARVAIGHTSPAQQLDVLGAIRVSSAGDRKIDFLRTGGNHYSIEHDTNQIYFWNHTTSESALLIQNDGDVIMSAGNIGIGTSSPATKLDVAGFMRTQLGAVFQGQSNISTGVGLEVGYSGALSKAFLQSYDRTNSAYKGINYLGADHTFLIGGSSAFTITSSGTGAIGTLSGQALKASVYGISIGSTEVISSARNLTNIVSMTASGDLKLTTPSVGTRNIIFNENGSDVIGIKYSGNVSGNPFDIHNFQGAGTTLVRVLESGNVGIGKNPSVKLDVDGQMRGEEKIEIITDSNDKARFSDDQDNYIEMDGGAFEMDFALDSTVQARMFDNGDFHINGTLTQNSTQVPSDIKLKKNITPIDNALSLVDSLKGVHFDWRKDDKKAIGFIAQEVEEVLPELVSEVSELHNREEKHKTVDYQSVIPVLVEAIKEQQRQIEALQAQINNI